MTNTKKLYYDCKTVKNYNHKRDATIWSVTYDRHSDDYNIFIMQHNNALQLC